MNPKSFLIVFEMLPQLFWPSVPVCSLYPEITSDEQRHDYKREFDADLREYKRMCADMDDINDQLNKLSRQLDSLDDTSAKYQVRHTTAAAQKKDSMY